MKVLVAVAAIAAGLFVLDRLLLAAESRGWIYWRRRKASPGTAASAALEIQSFLQPSTRHVLEAKHAEEGEADPDRDDAGDGSVE